MVIRLSKMKLICYSSLQKLDMGHHNTRVGTIRYMAPEVLSKTINGQDLEALTKADM